MLQKLQRASHSTFGALLAMSLTSACMESEREIQGTLDLGAVGHTQAELTANRADGVTQQVNVGSDGRFSVALAEEHAYAISFSDPTSSEQAFAVLVYRKGDMRTRTVRIADGDPLTIGRVARCNPMPGSDAEVLQPLVAEVDLAEANAPDLEDHALDPLAPFAGELRCRVAFSTNALDDGATGDGATDDIDNAAAGDLDAPTDDVDNGAADDVDAQTDDVDDAAAGDADDAASGDTDDAAADDVDAPTDDVDDAASGDGSTDG